MNRAITINSINWRRIMLHIAFWAGVFILFVIIYSVKTSYAIATRDNVFYMPLHISYFYLIVYWLIPQYLFNAHYVKFVAYLLALATIVGLAGRVIDILIVDPYLLKT